MSLPLFLFAWLFFTEEELKRLQRALNSENSYSEVGFNYDEDNKPTQEYENKDDEDDEKDPFIPPYQLDLPVGMKIVSKPSILSIQFNSRMS